MARKSPASGPPRQSLLRLPAVEAAARRLDALLSDGENHFDDADAAASNPDDDICHDDPPLDLEAREFGCSIALFRPFDERCARYARNWIIPLLDGYGRVTHVTDNAFVDADCGSDRMSLSGKKFGAVEWRQKVSDLFDTLDVAVVETSSITDNILWEMETSYRRLPSERVVLVACSTGSGFLERHTTTLCKILKARRVSLGNEPVLAYAGDAGLGLFAQMLHVRMRDIVVASTAAWEVALEAAEKEDDHPAMMAAYHNLGEAAYNLGNPRPAMDWFHLALVVAKTLGDRAAMRRMHLRLQAAASAAGDDEQWFQSFEALGHMLGRTLPEKK